jgi:hypothetical protein
VTVFALGENIYFYREQILFLQTVLRSSINLALA